MGLPRTIRLIVPWIAGFYFVAQIVGVTSLVAVHLHHTYQSELAIAADLAMAGHVDHGHERGGHHQHGASDLGDQCCTVHHHLSAVLPLELTPNLLGFAIITLLSPSPAHLAGADPNPPDHPPKLLLSV